MINFKHEKDKDHFLYCSPKLIEVMYEMYHFFEDNGHPFTVTSFIRTPEENAAVGAKSSTHIQGRAFDIRTRDLPQAFLVDCVTYFNHKFANVAAWSKSRGKPTLCILKNDHIHVQVHYKYISKYAQNAFKEGKNV